MQENDSTTTNSLQVMLAKVEMKLKNLAEAIAQGIFSSTTRKCLTNLKDKKKQPQIGTLSSANKKSRLLAQEQIEFGLCSLRKIDISTQEGKQRLIDTFVNSIYLYDDHFVISFNYKGQAKTVTFEQLNSSPLTSTGSPNKMSAHFVLFFGNFKSCATKQITNLSALFYRICGKNKKPLTNTVFEYIIKT